MAEAIPPSPPRACWITRAFPMTGQRRAMLVNLPPPGEEWRVVEVDSWRSVAGVAFIKKGHTAFDWRRTASMVAVCIFFGFGIDGVLFSGGLEERKREVGRAVERR